MTVRYFDNAATSFPKPPRVAEAMFRFMTENGAPGRGTHAPAREAGRLIRQCRERINRLINGENPDHVVFTHNTTDALNLAIKGVLEAARRASRGSTPHIVSTWMEHNSVLRPINALIELLGEIEWTRIEADPETGLVDADAVRRAIRPGHTALVAVNHASNVTGTIQPVATIGEACRAAGVPYLVDAAQSLGHIEVDVRAMKIDLLAFPGHKGLLGPTGTGGLYIRPGLESRVATVREGGTGSVSEQETHPTMMPEKYEAGSHNIVGIVGLSEGVAWLLERGVSAVREHEVGLMKPMLAAVETGEFPGAILLGPRRPDDRVGVFSIVHESLEPQEIAAALETGFGILTRAGLHCAPLAHRTFGTAPPHGRGAVRLSFGPFLASDDVRSAIDALAAICREHAPASTPAGAARRA
ncbi:MAG: aminotransferase class V-fold PLP-dependent enzyme [Phycisphaerales bacterium]|nr:aminotransferase class V-fold PLP-dependent enzyme [Phycisphaerales bacterium]